jgi:hypothetical protein
MINVTSGLDHACCRTALSPAGGRSLQAHACGGKQPRNEDDKDEVTPLWSLSSF